MNEMDIITCEIPGNAKWVIGKIMEAKRYIMTLISIQGCLNDKLKAMVYKNKFKNKYMYTTLRPQFPQV